jgi:glucose/arabinose dehydrogenase
MVSAETSTTQQEPASAEVCAGSGSRGVESARSSAGGSAATYIGRVGALAVALGVTGAVVMTPGIARADESPSSSSEAGPSGPSATGSDTTAGAAGSDTTSNPTRENATDRRKVRKIRPGAATARPPWSLSDLGKRFALRPSGGGGREGDAAQPEETPAESGPDPRTNAGDGVVNNNIGLVGSTRGPSKPDVSRASGPKLRSPQPKAADEPSTAISAESPSHSVTTPIAQVATAAAPIAAAPKPSVRNLVSLVGAALTRALGTAPKAPPESPVLLAMLAWARKQFENLSAMAAPRSPAVQTEELVTMAAPDVAAAAATALPDELERTVLVTGLQTPVDFRILPGEEGEEPSILIAEKNGAIKLYHDGHIGTIATLPVTTANERGIGGIELDPDFTTNRYIYVSYTTQESGIDYNRLSRFTLSEDLHSLEPGSERNIVRMTEPGPIHHGGEIRFGPDRMLYWSTGDNSYSPNAQDLGSLHGKVMRFDPDTLQAAADNPFVGVAGARPEIYAYGLRNPFRFSFAPDGTLFVADVGSRAWEELNVVTAGANYGWPAQEGPCGSCAYVNPVWAYEHTAPPESAGAITAVLYYTGDALGEQYQNKVFVTDYALGWIKVLDIATDGAGGASFIGEETFDAEAGTTVALAQGQNGYLYQLTIYPGELSVIAPSGGNRTPQAVITATPDNGYAELEVQFSGANSTDPEGESLSYSWDFGVDGDDDTSTEVAPVWTYSQDGAYLVTLTVTDPQGKSGQTVHRVVVGSTAPIINEIAVSQTTYNAGDTITFNATASDAEDGRNGDHVITDPDAYSWVVDFHHADHIHPYQDAVSGTGGSFTINRDPHNVDTSWYRIILTVTDSSGLSTTQSVDVYPNLVELTFEANDPDAVYTIDGVPHKGTYTETAVVGVERVIAAVTPQSAGGKRLVFGSWSDGQLPSHTIVTPASATTYAITYDDYVAPGFPDPTLILAQVWPNQTANGLRLFGATIRAGEFLIGAIGGVPTEFENGLANVGKDPAQIPAAVAGALTGSVGVLSTAIAPIMNVAIEVAAAEALRAVAVTAVLAANVVPVAVSVLSVPVGISVALVDSALDLLDVLMKADEQGIYGAFDRTAVRVPAAITEQRAQLLGAVADVLTDIVAAAAIPLPAPVPADRQPSSDDPLAPILDSLQRGARLAEQVGESAVDIATAVGVGQQRIGQTAAAGIRTAVAARPAADLVLHWVAHTLASVKREAKAGRLTALEGIADAGYALEGAGGQH